LPAGRCITDPEASGNLAGQSAPLEIRDRRGRGFQLLAVKLSRLLHDFVEIRLFGFRLRPALIPAALELGKLHADRIRKLSDRLDVAQALVLHHKRNRVPVRPAAEAVIELLAGADRE